MKTPNISRNSQASSHQVQSFKGPVVQEQTQLQQPAKKDLEVRKATNRVATGALDAFQNADQKAFSAANYLMQTAANGKNADTAGLLKAAKFNPKELTRDLNKIASELSKNPADTIQNMMFGLPTKKIDQALKQVDKGLQTVESNLRSYEDQHGLRKEWAGANLSGQGSVNAGASGIDAQGQSSGSLGAGFDNTSRLDGALGSASNRTRASVDNSYQASGSAHAGLSGVEVQGSVQAKIAQFSGESTSSVQNALGTATQHNRLDVGLQGESQGRIKASASGLEAQGQIGASGHTTFDTGANVQTAIGQASARQALSLEGYARTQGQATMDARGAQMSSKTEVGVSLKSDVHIQCQSTGLELGGERLDVRGEGRMLLLAEAKAEGTVKGALTISPPRAVAEFEGKTFVGAKCEFEGKIGLGRFVALTGSAEFRAGAGAQGRGVLGFENGKLRVGGGFGAAIGLGAGVKGGIEIDVNAMFNAAVGTGIELAVKGLQAAINPAAALHPQTLLADLLKKFKP